MGCMTKNHCHVMTIVMRIFPNMLRNTNGVAFHLIHVYIMFIKQQGCKEPCKKKMSQFLEYFKIFLERLKDSTQIHCLRRCSTKESTCLLRHITTEKSGLCQYAVCALPETLR